MDPLSTRGSMRQVETLATLSHDFHGCPKIMLGEPIENPAGVLDTGAGLPVSAVTATAAAAAPPAARAIQSHLCPLGPALAVDARASGESEREIEQVVPARACPLSAVIRTSSEPA